MTQQTNNEVNAVLTEAQRTDLCAQYLAGMPPSIYRFILMVEQAALASPEVQALRKDAERWNLFRVYWKTANIRNDPKTGNFKSATVTLSSDPGKFQAPLDDMADTILAAMENQK